ncbi:MAG: PspC domain-containing protein [Flavobacterium sp.]
MNKTVNINIGGLFFHIDEDAYQKLSHYFEAIKRSLSNTSGQDEIMKDIEMRVAELLIEKQKSDKQVVNNKDVDEVITVMGQPEDYRIDQEIPETPYGTDYSPKRKLYRDGDRGLIGGVATGLGHYFGLDAVIFKIIFVFLTVFGGSGILVYLILWIAIPKAVTTSEKLEMTGEPVNISTIEKKVKEEYEYISNKLKDVDFDKIGNRVKTSGIGEVIIKIFTIFAKLLGAFIILISSVSIFGLLIGLFTLGTTSITSTPNLRYINALNYTEAPLWLVGILVFLAFGIPLLFFLLLGLKLVITKFSPVNNIIKYSSLAIWIFAIIGLIIFGVKQSLETAYDGKTIIKENIKIKSSDTLKIKFINNDFFSKEISQHIDFAFTQDSLKNEVIYSNKIRFEIKSTDKSQPYLQIERLAEGKSFKEANDRAEKIRYSYKIIDNQLLLDNYLLTDINNKYRNQQVKLYLYLPGGTIFSTDKSVDEYNETDREFFDLDFESENHIYKIKDNQVKCLNCLEDDNDTISLQLKGNEIIKTKTTKKGKLIIGKDGIIIDTN